MMLQMYMPFFHQTLSKMEEHFPRSKEFIPEKWAAEKSDPLYYGNAHLFAFRPFGFWTSSFIEWRAIAWFYLMNLVYLFDTLYTVFASGLGCLVQTNVLLNEEAMDGVESTVFIEITVDAKLQLGPYIAELGSILSSATHAVKEIRSLTDEITANIKMQTVRRSVFNFGAIRQLCSRSVTVDNAVKIQEENIHLKSWKDIPGPSSLPIIGQLLHFLPGGILYNSTESMWKLLYENYGPIVRLDLGSEPIIMIFDAKSAASILRSENWMPIRIGLRSLDYYRQKYQKSENSPLGLLTDQNEEWKKLRSTVNPIMLQPKTIKQYSDVLEEVSEDMIARMRQKRNEKFMIEGNFDFEMNLWALESISVVALGCRLNCLTRDLPENSPEKKLIEIVHDIFTLGEELDVKPSLWRYFSTPTFRKAMKCYGEQMELSKHFIKKSIQEMKKSNKDNEKSVLEKLLEINEDMAIVMATDMLFAGIDTAANTITATLYLLAVNQDKQDKLREEILSNKAIPYLKACLKESMRMMPVVPGNSRMTTKDYNILGYKISKNMRVAFGHEVLASLNEQFPRANEYIPERWIVDKTDPLYHGNADPMAYLPFGFGARMCIGRRIAELETETFLSKVIENFKVEWFGPPLKVRPSVINYTMPPFNFVFKDIK